MAANLIIDAATVSWRRRARTAATLAAVAVGLAAFTASVLLSASGSAAIGAQFDALKATRLVITVAPGESVGPDAVQRVRDLDGVTAAGRFVRGSDSKGAVVSRLPATLGDGADAGTQTTGSVVLADSGALAAFGVQIVAGRPYDVGHERRGDRVAIADLALVDGLGGYTPGMSVWVDGEEIRLVGVYRSPDEETVTTGALLLPLTATWRGDQQDPDDSVSTIVRTRRGAADVVADQVARVVMPTDFEHVAVQVPADARGLAGRVGSDLSGLSTGLAAISLLIGGLIVSNSMTVAVLERRQEIGLRRAVGATRWSITAQVVLESTVLGLLGGLAGLLIGVELSTLVCLVRGWPLDARWADLALAPALGAAAGALGGWRPARSAARIEPAEALRAT
jgi:ABC-type antimicrobial peptide transport system permease subunit